MNSVWDIRIFLGLVTKESPCTIWDMSEGSEKNHENLQSVYTLFDAEIQTIHLCITGKSFFLRHIGQ